MSVPDSFASNKTSRNVKTSNFSILPSKQWYSQTYCEFTIYFLYINLTRKVKIHIVKKKKSTPKFKSRSSSQHRKPSPVTKSPCTYGASACVCPEAGEVLKFLECIQLLVLPTSYTSCFMNFFFFHFWEKNILKCSKSYSVSQTSKFLPSFQICLFQAYSLPISDPEKVFSCLLLPASSVQLQKSNLFSHLGPPLPTRKSPPPAKGRSPFTSLGVSSLFLFHDIPFLGTSELVSRRRPVPGGGSGEFGGLPCTASPRAGPPRLHRLRPP